MRRSSAERCFVVVSVPASMPYGERQYSVVDLGGHTWTFYESEADVDPSAWGGELVEPPSHRAVRGTKRAT